MVKLPFISKEKSNFKIITNSGHVFYVHNLQDEYRYDERIKVIQNFKSYFSSISNPTPEQDAYCVLLWSLFSEFLNAYNFNWIRSSNTNHSKKDLYILRNSNGFIKIGVASNVNIRIVDLKYEFGGEWEIIKIFKGLAKYEKLLHGKLANYIYPIKHRHTGKYSNECFNDCEEVLSACLNLSNNE